MPATLRKGSIQSGTLNKMSEVNETLVIKNKHSESSPDLRVNNNGLKKTELTTMDKLKLNKEAFR